MDEPGVASAATPVMGEGGTATDEQRDLLARMHPTARFDLGLECNPALRGAPGKPHRGAGMGDDVAVVGDRKFGGRGRAYGGHARE